MVIRTDGFRFEEQFSIKLGESTLIKIEDSLKKNSELLITIDASHYGFRNGNATIYRHDTVSNDINTFVYPRSKPIIEKHNLRDSVKYGEVIAADFKLTGFYNDFNSKFDIEDLTTEEYIALCKDHIIPFQKKRSDFNGLAFLQITGRLTNKDGIRKVLNNEFLTVSVGAEPKKLICSECLQDQTKKICEHYRHKRNRHRDIFMLSEELEYEELSFVDTPADKFGRITKIHDGISEEFVLEEGSNILTSNVDVIDLKDFFKLASGKKIVCVENICKIINQEEVGMKKKVISLTEEFTNEVISAIKIVRDSEEVNIFVEDLKLSDEDKESLTSKQFAIVQKTDDGDKYRFPLNNEIQVRAGLALIDSAEDLTDSEMKKAKMKLSKAAEKFNITTVEKIEDVKVTDSDDETTETETDVIIADSDVVTSTKIETILDELKAELGTIKELADEYTTEQSNPKENAVGKLFEIIKWFSMDIAVAGSALNASISSFLEDQGMKTISDSVLLEMNDKISKNELKEANIISENNLLEIRVSDLNLDITQLKDEIDVLEELNKDLNYEIRVQTIDELINSKIACGILEDSDIDTERNQLVKMPFNLLVSQTKDYRKLTAKLKDSVNNIIEIKKVADPTLHDSAPEESETQDPMPRINPELSQAEVQRVFVDLFRRNRK